MSAVARETARPASTSRDLAMIGVFAGITAALGLVPPLTVPGVPAPITAQSLGVMLAGAVLGARRGLLSQLLFIVLVALGLPLLSGGRGGLGWFMGPSGGFLVGYILCAGVVGWLTERIGAPYSVWKGVLANILGGIVVMDVLGIAGFMGLAHLGLGKSVLLCSTYLIGDLVKSVVAALVASGVHRSYPGLLRERR